MVIHIRSYFKTEYRLQMLAGFLAVVVVYCEHCECGVVGGIKSK